MPEFLDCGGHYFTLIIVNVSEPSPTPDASTESGPGSATQLLPLVYDELRRLAARKLAGEKAGQTLQATALVHEAWLRLSGTKQIQWNDRTHFFATAAEAMRHILIDNARRKLTLRHGAAAERANLESLNLASEMPDDQLLAVNEALDKLEAHDKEKAELVKLRFFAGLTLEEAAGVLSISKATAKRHWAYARAWLFRELKAAA
jgi:RNA polymerase sigma factor (TIGR02999 family)